MSEIWTQEKIQELIDREEPEGLTREYKGADALGTNNDKRDEITKDISAMANSTGGIVIFGVARNPDKNFKHLPDRIDPIDQSVYSIEWLGHKISLIQPRIEGINIYPVNVDTYPNHVVYVVEIPQSTTAHQATDLHYYKRFDTRSVPMYDYEIRDVMGRQQHPKIVLCFEIEFRNEYAISLIPYGEPLIVCYLKTTATNDGKVYANYVNCLIKLPINFCPEDEIEFMRKDNLILEEEGEYYYQYFEDNTVRDMTGGLTYGPRRFSPILPHLSREWETKITTDVSQIQIAKQTKAKLKWYVYADNAPVNSGIFPVADIPILDGING